MPVNRSTYWVVTWPHDSCCEQPLPSNERDRALIVNYMGIYRHESKKPLPTASMPPWQKHVVRRIYFPAAGARRRNSSKKFNRNVSCVEPFCSDVNSCTAAKRVPSGARSKERNVFFRQLYSWFARVEYLAIRRVTHHHYALTTSVKQFPTFPGPDWAFATPPSESPTYLRCAQTA